MEKNLHKNAQFLAVFRLSPTLYKYIRKIPYTFSIVHSWQNVMDFKLLFWACLNKSISCKMSALVAQNIQNISG